MAPAATPAPRASREPSSPAGASPPGEAVLLDSVARLLATVRGRFPDADLDVITRAYELAAEAHAGQRRASGDPYITHPLAVATILGDLGMDPAAVAAALLHDVIEDTAVSRERILALFGPEVGHLVDGVTKISAIEARGRAPSEAENLRRMLVAAVNDLRVILIKLADRLHNMQTIGALSPERRRRMAQETLDIYAPLANRLGIWRLKSQFEDLALRELDPDGYQRIDREVAERRHEYRDYLADVIAQLDERLRAAGIAADISTRAKHYYSIYRKMQRKGVGVEQIYDILAVRVIVDEVPQCYLTLGLVHAMWPPVRGEFDDYIAKGKENLYQSLHSTVLGPGNRPLEIQIRTHAMHKVAEEGMPAHWDYKEGTGASPETKEKFAALRRLLQSQDDEATDAETFVEGLKTDVFRDQVYVFTPNGEVITLPVGSTPVDFAYHIHSEVGHRCRGARVDGRMVALDTPLQTGQTVRIVTAKGEAGPSRDWLNPALGFAVSARARARIAQWFRRQARATTISEGREVVDRQLRKLGLTRWKHDEVARLFDHDRLDEFLAAVGRHDIPAEAISARLLESESPTVAPAGATPPALEPGVRLPSAAALGATTLGTSGLHTRVAGCCRPLPGEEVLGYVTRGSGITLHRVDCRNIARLRSREPDRFKRVHWPQTDEHGYPVELEVVAYDRPALVRDISDVIARGSLNMTSISAASNPSDGTAVVTVMVEIPSRAQLTALIDKLGALPNVVDVHRRTS